MAGSHTQFKPVSELVRLAFMQSSGAVADEFRQSPPIPVNRPDGLRILFLFSPALARPKQPIMLHPPRFLIRLSAETGKLEELRAVTPADFGQSHGPADVIGTFAMPEGMTVEAFRDQRDRLYEAYDVLLPVFAARRSPPDAQIRAAARLFSRHFAVVGEPPLHPYYRAVGSEFFDWVEAMAR